MLTFHRSGGVFVFIIVLCIFCQTTLAEADSRTAKWTEERSSQTFRRQVTYAFPRVRNLVSTGHPVDDVLTVDLATPTHNWTLDLQLNRMVAGSALVHEFHEADGKRRVKHNRDQLCHYQGTVKGHVGSWTAMSTCHGLDGAFSDGKHVYIVEPVKRSERLPLSRSHVVYKREDEKWESTCGVTNNFIAEDNNLHIHSAHAQGLFHGHRRQLRQASKTRYIELLLVVDKQAYTKIGGTSSLAKTFVVSVANFLDTVYKPLGIRVALTSAIYWTTTDPINIVTDPSLTLDAFNTYRQNNWIKDVRYPNDDAQLITGVDFTGSTKGLAGINTICSPTSATGVNQHGGTTFAGVAYTMAHELGHNLNMNHDDGRSCNNCTSSKCIMAAVGGPSSVNAFSQCSQNDLQELLSKGGGPCLDNVPTQTFGDPVCGNGLLETGEQCDCGSVLECTDPCCNATSCRLTTGSQCASGDCCLNCRFRPATYRCRNAATECDVAEYCSGNSGYCPENLVKSSGTSCSAGQAYCWDGECRTITKQCQTLWGQSATIADQRCYDRLNIRGDQYGNCGKNSSGTYRKCSANDVLCGALQCSTTATRPIIGSSYRTGRVTYTEGGISFSCKTASVDLGDDIPDPGLALDGVACGNGTVCENQRCIALTLSNTVRAQQCPVIGHSGKQCSATTVCTNRGMCVDPSGPSTSTNSAIATSTTPPISTGQSTIVSALRKLPRLLLAMVHKRTLELRTQVHLEH